MLGIAGNPDDQLLEIVGWRSSDEVLAPGIRHVGHEVVDVATIIEDLLDLVVVGIEPLGDGQRQRHQAIALIGALHLEIGCIGPPVGIHVPGPRPFAIGDNLAGIGIAVDIDQFVRHAGRIEPEALGGQLAQPDGIEHHLAHHPE